MKLQVMIQKVLRMRRLNKEFCGKQILAIICLLSIQSCIHSANPSEVSHSDPLAVYIEARSSEGVESGNYGDPVILNLRTGTVFRPFSDDYFDASPTLSPDRTTLAFSSNRVGSPLVLAVRGAGGPRELYTYKIAEGVIRRINSNQFVAKNIRFFFDMQWSPDQTCLLFKKTQSVYAYYIERDSLAEIYKLDKQDEFIGYFMVAPSDSLIAMQIESGRRKRIEILDWKKCKLVRSLDNLSMFAELGGWFPSGAQFLIMDTVLRRYDVVSGQCLPLGFTSTALKKKLFRMFPISDSVVVFEQPSSEGGRNEEIFELNIRTKAQCQLSKGSQRRGDLSIVLPRTIEKR